MSTKIEWTHRPGTKGETWNPVTGCAKVSPGCEHCYALTMSHRLGANPTTKHKYAGTTRKTEGGKVQWTSQVYMHEDALLEPLKWKKPRTVFVGSMADVFHPDVHLGFLVKLFTIMAGTPQHTYLMLTKRPERMSGFLERYRSRISASVAVFSNMQPGYHDPRDPSDPQERIPWPLPNVWLGTSVENQAQADTRIPHLLQSPAAVRFLSCEPLLGLVDLSDQIMPTTPFTPENAPATWADFDWPEWVPESVSNHIEKFWSWVGRSPKSWADNARHNDSPPFGSRMAWEDRTGTIRKGRWVFAWNNMGRLIADDGTVYYPSIPRSHIFDTTKHYWHKLHWVIAGGESGPGARPMHPDWVRSIRDQCQAANVPFFFKQWGAWVDEHNNPAPQWEIMEYKYPVIRMDGIDNAWNYAMSRVGKSKSGNTLDGSKHQEWPTPTTNHKPLKTPHHE